LNAHQDIDADVDTEIDTEVNTPTKSISSSHISQSRVTIQSIALDLARGCCQKTIGGGSFCSSGLSASQHLHCTPLHMQEDNDICALDQHILAEPTILEGPPKSLCRDRTPSAETFFGALII
jgi:hypothetical protein